MNTLLISMAADVQYAFWPLFLWVLGGIGVLGVIGALTATEGTKLGVIGMKGAGKTTYLAHLKLVEHDGGTSTTKYDGKKVDVGHRIVEIAAGEDIGGEEEFMRYYEPWLVGNNKKDIILFIFDGCRYLKDPEYRDSTNRRLQFIYEKYKAGNNDTKDYKNLVMIASHFDEYDKNKDVDEMCKDILGKIGKANYVEMFKNNFVATDLRKSDMVSDMNLKLFP